MTRRIGRSGGAQEKERKEEFDVHLFSETENSRTLGPLTTQRRAFAFVSEAPGMYAGSFAPRRVEIRSRQEILLGTKPRAQQLRHPPAGRVSPSSDAAAHRPPRPLLSSTSAPIGLVPYQRARRRARRKVPKVATATPAVGTYKGQVSKVSGVGYPGERPSDNGLSFIFDSALQRFTKPPSSLTDRIGPGFYTPDVEPDPVIVKAVPGGGSAAFKGPVRKGPFDVEEGDGIFANGIYLCSHQGCANEAVLGGVCDVHGGNLERAEKLQRMCSCPTSERFLRRKGLERRQKNKERDRRRLHAQAQG